MNEHRGPATRLLVFAAVGVLSASMLLGTAEATPPLDAPDDSPPEQLLVDLGGQPIDADQATIVRELGSGWVLVEASPGNSDLTAVLNSLGLTWEPDTVYELMEDPLFGDQWWLENTGQLGGLPDADIDGPEAWALSTADSGQLIAVIDTGVDLDHVDLIDRIWTNSGEIPGNSTDDDGNDYTDDINGWDTLDGDADPDDTYGHGTAVAGTAAASANAVGVVGVAPDATIMPIRACDHSGCLLSAVVEGIHYAVDNGADIINLSLGSHSSDQALEAAIAAANNAGVLVVAAAGNGGTNNDAWPFYPANIDLSNVVSVAATDRNDALATFISGASNYGASTVDLGAPGKDIYTTDIGVWVKASGTSVAAPMVAGTAALLLNLRPEATPSQIIAALIGTVDELPTLGSKTRSGGRLNAHSAVLATEPPTANAVGMPTLGWEPLTISVSAAGSADPGGGPLTWEWSSNGATASGFETDIVLSEIGVQEVLLTVTDVFGSTATDSVIVLVGRDFLDTTTSIFRLETAWMSALGITRGCNPPTNDRYCPHDTVTREQMAAFLARALDLPTTGTDHFIDDDSSIFEQDINRLAAAGITKGCNPPTNDRYCPHDTVTREQMAAFLYRSNA